VNPIVQEILLKRAKQLGNLPAMPKILSVLNEALVAPVGQVDVENIVRTISYDESLVAQCLRMANSALYRQRGEVDTVMDAVVSLGLWRIRDLVFSCALPRMFTSLSVLLPKEVFWHHALATALLSQKLSDDLGHSHNAHVYLAGLLHDIGILTNALLFPEDFNDVFREAISERIAITSVEKRVLGFTHAESGRVLADAWKLPLESAEAIEFHHSTESQPEPSDTTLFVHLADQFCLQRGSGYGYAVLDGESDTISAGWSLLAEKFPRARRFTGEEYAVVVDSTLVTARDLADRVFGPVPLNVPK